MAMPPKCTPRPMNIPNHALPHALDPPLQPALARSLTMPKIVPRHNTTLGYDGLHLFALTRPWTSIKSAPVSECTVDIVSVPDRAVGIACWREGKRLC